MNKQIVFLLLALVSTAFAFTKSAQEPWTKDQLIEPSQLSGILNDPSAKQPILYSIGFGGGIKNSVDIGPVKDSINLNKWKKDLEKLPKNADIVIYCGCCPFEYCPNIRPAFQLLNEMKFANQKLLNLPHNLKMDWIDKGYPVKQ